MSRSIHKPWISQFVVDCLGNTADTDEARQRVSAIRSSPICVQVIAYHEESRTLTVSDTDVFIHTFLTEECHEELFKEYNWDTLRCSQVNLVQFCLTTVTQVSGKMNIHNLRNAMIPFPLAFQCSKLSYLGGSDCNIIGEPRSVNQQSKIVAILRKYKYFEMRERLALLQFPLQKSLPDCDGDFSFIHEYGPDHELDTNDFVQDEIQNRIIDNLNSYEYSFIVEMLPSIVADYSTSGGVVRRIAKASSDGISTSVTEEMHHNVSNLDGTGWSQTARDDEDYFPPMCDGAIQSTAKATNIEFPPSSPSCSGSENSNYFPETAVDTLESQELKNYMFGSLNTQCDTCHDLSSETQVDDKGETQTDAVSHHEDVSASAVENKDDSLIVVEAVVRNTVEPEETEQDIENSVEPAALTSNIPTETVDSSSSSFQENVEVVMINDGLSTVNYAVTVTTAATAAPTSVVPPIKNTPENRRLNRMGHESESEFVLFRTPLPEQRVDDSCSSEVLTQPQFVSAMEEDNDEDYEIEFERVISEIHTSNEEMKGSPMKRRARNQVENTPTSKIDAALAHYTLEELVEYCETQLDIPADMPMPALEEFGNDLETFLRHLPRLVRDFKFSKSFLENRSSSSSSSDSNKRQRVPSTSIKRITNSALLPPLDFAFLTDEEIEVLFPHKDDARNARFQRTLELQMALHRERNGYEVPGLQEYRNRQQSPDS